MKFKIKHLTAWIVFLIGSPLILALDQSAHTDSVQSLPITCVSCIIFIVTLFFLLSFCCTIVYFGFSRNRPTIPGLKMGLVLLELVFAGLYFYFITSLPLAKLSSISEKLILLFMPVIGLLGFEEITHDLDRFKSEYEIELRQVESTTLSMLGYIEYYNGGVPPQKFSKAFTDDHKLKKWPEWLEWVSTIRAQYDGTRVASLYYQKPEMGSGLGIFSTIKKGISYTRIGTPINSSEEKLSLHRSSEGELYYFYEWNYTAYGKTVIIRVHLEK